MRTLLGLGGSSPLLFAVAAATLVACGDNGGTASQTDGGTGNPTTGATVDNTTGTSNGSMSDSEASVTQGTGSAGMTMGTSGDDPTSTGTSTTTGPGTTTSPGTDGTTSTGAVSASSSTGDPGPVCGNGVVEEGEECDDGDDLDKNKCSNACTKVPCDQQEGGGDMEGILSYIWIANSSQNTVSKIDSLIAANSGVYARIQRVG